MMILFIVAIGLILIGMELQLRALSNKINEVREKADEDRHESREKNYELNKKINDLSGSLETQSRIGAWSYKTNGAPNDYHKIPLKDAMQSLCDHFNIELVWNSAKLNVVKKSEPSPEG